MPVENNIQRQMLVGTGGVTKGRAVKLSSGTVVAFAAADDAFFGVPMQGAPAGQYVAVVVAGECDVEAGGTLTDGGDLITNAAGEFVNQAASGSQTIDGYAKALEGGADGRYSRVLIYETPKAAVGA